MLVWRDRLHFELPDSAWRLLYVQLHGNWTAWDAVLACARQLGTSQPARGHLCLPIKFLLPFSQARQRIPCDHWYVNYAFLSRIYCRPGPPQGHPPLSFNPASFPCRVYISCFLRRPTVYKDDWSRLNTDRENGLHDVKRKLWDAMALRTRHLVFARFKSFTFRGNVPVHHEICVKFLFPRS